MVIFYVDFAIIGVFIVLGFLVGESIIYRLASFLLGPARYVIFAIFALLVVLLVIKGYYKNVSAGILEKIISGVMHFASCIMRYGTLLALLFVLLLECTTDSIFDNLINGIGGIFIMVFVSCVFIAIDIWLSGKQRDNYYPIICGIENIFLSLVAVLIVQAMFLYENYTIETILKDRPVLLDLLQGNWFINSPVGQAIERML